MTIEELAAQLLKVCRSGRDPNSKVAEIMFECRAIAEPEVHAAVTGAVNAKVEGAEAEVEVEAPRRRRRASA